MNFKIKLTQTMSLWLFFTPT